MALYRIAVVLFVCLARGFAAAALSATDRAVLQFALNLEYLEANFYSCAAYGMPINSTLWGNGGVAPVGCKKAKLSRTLWQLADELAQDEIAHVTLLRAVLGTEAVPQPKLDIGPAFVTAANAAVSLALNRTTKLSPDFSPYSGDVTFLHGAFIFEDVGATAYAGAAALIEDKVYLTAAAQILAVESYHAGAIRLALAQIANYPLPFKRPPGLKVRDAVAAISALRDAVDGPQDSDQGILRAGSRLWNIVPTDSNGLIYTRNTDQILAIVYLGGTRKGGFFPQGLNGVITEVSA